MRRIDVTRAFPKAMLAVLCGVFLHGATAQAQQVTTLELRRELDQLDKDVGVLKSRQASLDAVSAAIQPAVKRIAEFEVPDVAAKSAALRQQIDGYVQAIDAQKGGSVPTQRKKPPRKSELVTLWTPISDGLQSLQGDLDPINARLSDVLRSIYNFNRAEDLRSLAADLQEGVDREVQPLFMAMEEVRRFNRGDQSMPALETLRSRTLPSLTTLVPRLKPNLQSAVAAFQKKLDSEREANAQTLRQKTTRQADLVKDVGRREEGQQKTDTALLTYALPSFAGLLIALMVIPKFYVLESQHSIFQSGLLLELITVFLLTATILLLGIAGKLSSEVLGTLIGGISGYVLGRWRRRDETDQAGAAPVTKGATT